jgi:protein-S-isoprenylcysteine O-methyltransferase Ste14
MDFAKAARDPWVWGQLLLIVAVLLAAPLLPRHINLGSADFVVNRIDPLSIRWLGGAIMLVGTTLLLWGVHSLGRNLTPGIEPVAGGELVTTGAYTHFRHPIYAGLVLLLAGYTLAWSNWTLTVMVGLAALQYFNAKAKAEERWLLRRFPLYRSYQRQVRRRVW